MNIVQKNVARPNHGDPLNARINIDKKEKIDNAPKITAKANARRF